MCFLKHLFTQKLHFIIKLNKLRRQSKFFNSFDAQKCCAGIPCHNCYVDTAYAFYSNLFVSVLVNFSKSSFLKRETKTTNGVNKLAKNVSADINITNFATRSVPEKVHIHLTTRCTIKSFDYCVLTLF